MFLRFIRMARIAYAAAKTSKMVAVTINHVEVSTSLPLLQNLHDLAALHAFRGDERNGGKLRAVIIERGGTDVIALFDGRFHAFGQIELCGDGAAFQTARQCCGEVALAPAPAGGLCPTRI